MSNESSDIPLIPIISKQVVMILYEGLRKQRYNLLKQTRSSKIELGFRTFLLSN